jgi:2-dehydropantoate 2-reductase
MKHAILGAGAVGGLMGTALAHEGDHVMLLVRPRTHAQHPEILRLKRPYDTIEAPVRIETRLAEPVDVLWVAVKSHQLVAALRTVPSSAGITTIVPLLNGIEHVNLLRLRFNHERVVPATILVESERLAPGRIVQRSPFVRLALSMIGEQKLQGVAARLRHAGFSCEFQADEKTMLWSKLAFLAPFALIGTASDKDKQGIFADVAWRARLESAVGEAVRLPLRTERLSSGKKFWPSSKHYLQLCEAPCRRMCQPASCRSWTRLAVRSFGLEETMGSTCPRLAS